MRLVVYTLLVMAPSRPRVASAQETASSSSASPLPGANNEDKTYKICSISGGLDVTRLVSSTTRNFFQSALEDVELIREVISETAWNVNQNQRVQGEAASADATYGQADLNVMEDTLDWQARNEAYGLNLTDNDTTVTAGIGYCDDRDSRRVERFVSLSSNQPYVGTKQTDMALVEAAGNIFPWLVDRRSVKTSWWVPHLNGKHVDENDASTAGSRGSFEQLYTAAWIGTKGEAWLYYPPLRVYGHPLGFGDVLGSHYESQDEEFVQPNLPQNNPTRISYFTKPYPDSAVPGLSLITAQAPVYLTGTFGGYEYNETYIASTGVDIAVSAVSSYLDILQDRLTPGSFGLLVDAASDFTTVVISEHVVRKIFPAKTRMEPSRVTYDPNGEIVQDRRNQPYQPSDTILQPLVNLTNADWTALHQHTVNQVGRGQRDWIKLNITLTGDSEPTEFYALSDRWENVADWVLLVFVPVAEMDRAIDITSTSSSWSQGVGYNKNDTMMSAVTLNGVHGDELLGDFSIVNKGNLDLLVSLKALPSFVNVVGLGEKQAHSTSVFNDVLLPSGEILQFDFSVATSTMHLGTQSFAVTFRVQDAHYPDCMHSEDLGLQVTVILASDQCDAETQVTDSSGNCVCKSNMVQMGSYCLTYGALIGFLCIPIFVIPSLVVVFLLWWKAKNANAVWQINAADLKYDDPPQQIGQGGFGIVLLAEYRGTPVAVKKLHGTGLCVAGSGRKNWTGDSVVTTLSTSKHRPTHNTVGRDRQQDDDAISSTPTTKARRNLSSDTIDSVIGNQRGSGKGSRKPSLVDFAADMRLLSSLRHPCITSILGAVLPKNEEPWLVMECMDKSLAEVLHKSTVALEGDIIHGVLKDVTQGLQFLHNTEPGVVHGDVKSHNILIDSMFRAKVSDFGVTYKEKSMMKGTPLWMAPELLRRETDCTKASDVFSLGITLVEIYARKEPYEGEDIGTVLQEVADTVVNRRPKVPSSMPNRMSALMQDCLAANPSDRPTMEEIVSRVRRFKAKDVAPKSLIGRGASSMDDIEAEERHFALLLQRFPRHIAEALRDGEEVAPEDHDCATVFFCEIADFARLATELPQKSLFYLLQQLYGRMDQIAKEKEIFKVETTGESWMGVANCVKDQAGDHVKRTAEFALAVVAASNETFVDPANPKLGYVKLRVGFHTGPVLSNVIGSPQNPRYALFGDTVNTAARISSSDKNSKTGLVLCSEAAANLLREQAPHLEASPLDGVYWVNEKGKRATAAFERARARQKLRMMKQASNRSFDSADSAANRSFHSMDSAASVDYATDENASLSGYDEFTDLEGNLKNWMNRN